MEPGQQELPLPPTPAPWRGRKPKKWWVQRQAALAAHRAKKAKEKQAERQADLDFLTQTANENQGFALLPATGATKEEQSTFCSFRKRPRGSWRKRRQSSRLTGRSN